MCGGGVSWGLRRGLSFVQRGSQCVAGSSWGRGAGDSTLGRDASDVVGRDGHRVSRRCEPCRRGAQDGLVKMVGLRCPWDTGTAALASLRRECRAISFDHNVGGFLPLLPPAVSSSSSFALRLCGRRPDGHRLQFARAGLDGPRRRASVLLEVVSGWVNCGSDAPRKLPGGA